MPRVTVDIVTWNSQEYINTCLDSVLQQTYRDLAITVVDNASQDASVSIVESYADRGVKLIRNTTNEGYAPAHNQAILASDSQFILNLNPDVILFPTFVEQMVAAIEERPEIGSAAGKLLSISREQFHSDQLALETP